MQSNLDFADIEKKMWFGERPQSFSITTNGPARPIEDDLKWKFPGLEIRLQEFAFLHKLPN